MVWCFNKLLCSVCKTVFECSPNNACWCAQFPKFSTASATKTCMCQRCLSGVFQKSVNVYINQKGLAATLALAKKEQAENQWLEYIDYTVENGQTVFTKWAHLKRGTCCKNGCKNCPY